MLRKRFYILLFFLYPALCIAQNAYIEDGLWNALKNPQKVNFSYRTVIVMSDQVDLAGLIMEFDRDKVSLAERQHTVIRLLQEKANKSQKDVIGYLNSYEQQKPGSIINLESFWICNMIVAEVPASLIWKLAERDDIISLDLDASYITSPVKPVEEKPSEAKSVGGSETGLKVIGADVMWKKGYTGKNRITYSIDTGVWPDHPALSDRFLANFFPMSQCWFPYDSELPSDKTGSHGTHTLGTTCGLEKATNDTIGCAFNAYWICSDPVATSLATVKPLSDFMYAYEWAMNPDGDTSTVWDIPDAINNSWGYDAPTDTSLCESYASQMFLAVEAAGIADVFSAGNAGPGAQTIGSPHHINSNIVNSFTVGALDGNTVGYPIASFSSRGPSICGGSGSLLIMPEVSAPGVDVRSSINSNGYALYSGTSMAGPHVTGAVILLKEAFPYLSGSEILKALYFTATDLGDPGEDNTYGMGLINLSDAFDYLSSLYTPVPPDSNAFDAEILSITLPVEYYYCDSVINPQIDLYNNGITTVSSGTFYYKINNGSEFQFAWAGNLTSGQTLSITLPQITLLPSESSELSVYFKTDTVFHETSIINNHRIARFNHRPQVDIPFIEDFETGINKELWVIYNPNYNLTWDTMHAGGLLFSNYSADMQFNTALPNYQVDDLITPNFDFSSLSSATLKFDVAYQNFHPVLTDSLIISVSTDCGATFPFTIYRKGGQQLQTYDTVTPGFIPWRADQWRSEYIDLTAYTGNPSILIRFRGFNKRGNNLFLDNIKIFSGSEPAGVEQITNNSWKVWPNPAANVLNLEITEPFTESTKINITDITGNCIWENTLPNNFTGIYQINTSTLTQGIYMLKSADKKIFYRFIKIQ
jgi:subtilisin family serine protease